MGKVHYADFVKFLEDVSKVDEYGTAGVFGRWHYEFKPPEWMEEGWPFWCYEKHDKANNIFHLHFLDFAMDPMAGLFKAYCEKNDLEFVKGERTIYPWPETVYDVKLGGRTIATMHDTLCSRPTAHFICVETTIWRPAIDMVLSIPFWYEPPTIGSEDLDMYRKMYKI